MMGVEVGFGSSGAVVVVVVVGGTLEDGLEARDFQDFSSASRLRFLSAYLCKLKKGSIRKR
jgi:hypothetical protein